MIRTILIVLASLFTAAAIAVAVALLNLETLINDYRAQMEIDASQYFGRRVEFGPVKLDWKDGLAARFTHVKLGGANRAESQGEIASFLLRLDVKKMLKSRGKQLEVKQMLVSGVRINVTRREDGTWDFDDIAKRLGGRAQEKAKSLPSTEEAEDWFKELRIAGVELSDTVIVINDRELDRKLTLDELTLHLSDVVPGKDLSMDFSMILDDGAARAPLKLAIRLQPLPADLQFDEIPAVETELALHGLDLKTWGLLVPAKFVRPENGRLDVKLRARTDVEQKLALASGTLMLRDAVLVQDGVAGASADLSVLVGLEVGLADEHITLERFDVLAPGLKLNAQAKIREHSLNGVENVALDLSVQELSRLTSILPSKTALLPKELKLEGPFMVHADGNAQGGQLNVTLDEAHLAWEGIVDKPKGVRLGLDVTAKDQGKTVRFDPISLKIAEADLGGMVEVPARGKGLIKAHIDTGHVAIAQFKPLFPQLAEREKQAKAKDEPLRLEGNFQLVADVGAEDGYQTLDARIDLAQMRIKTSTFRMRGDGNLSAVAKPRNNEIAWNVSTDLTNLTLKYTPDNPETVLIEKKKEKLFTLAAKGTRRDSTVIVETFGMNLGSSQMQAAGRVDGIGTTSPKIDVDARGIHVLFDDIRELTTKVQQLPRGGELKLRALRAVGGVGEKDTLDVRADDLDITAGDSRIAGRAYVVDVKNPNLDVDLAQLNLNFTQLNRLTMGVPFPQKGTISTKLQVRGQPAKADTMFVSVDELDANLFNTRLQGRASVENFQEPKVDARLASDRIHVERLQADINAYLDSLPKSRKETKDTKKKDEPGVFSRTSGVVEADIGQLLYDKYIFDQVKGRVVLNRGVVDVDRLTWDQYQGHLRLTGSRVDTTKKELDTHLVLDVKELNLGKAIDDHSEDKGNVVGRLDANADVTATGSSKERILHTLKGPVSIASPEIKVHGVNLLAELFTKLQEASPVPIQTDKDMLDPNKPTSFGALEAAANIADEKIVFTRPLSSKTQYGVVSFSGEIGFDSTINLVGTASLTPQVIGQVTRGTINPPNAVLVPLQIGGTWNEPKLTGVDVGAFAKNLGLGNLVGDAKELADRARKDMEAKADAMKDNADKLRAQAVADARAKAEEAQAEAHRRAEEARKAAEEAARAPDELRRKAAEDAQRRAAEAEAKAAEARAFTENLVKDPNAKFTEFQADADAKRKQAESDAKAAAAEAKKHAEEARDKAKSVLDSVFE